MILLWILPVFDPEKLGLEHQRLKPEVVVSRHRQGEDITRSPCSLFVIANVNDTAAFSSGREVPVPVTSFLSSYGESQGGLPSVPVTSFQYRNVGINLSASAQSHQQHFRIRLEVERSSVYEEDAPATTSPQQAVHPSFRTLNSMNELLLKDGQRVECTSRSFSVGFESSLRVQSKLKRQACDFTDYTIPTRVVAEHDDGNSGVGYHDEVGSVTGVASAVPDGSVPRVF